MSSFTSDAERNRQLPFCWSTKVPACRSKTTIPAVTPAGFGTPAPAEALGLVTGPSPETPDASGLLLAGELGGAADGAAGGSPQAASASTAATAKIRNAERMAHPITRTSALWGVTWVTVMVRARCVA